MSDYNEIVDKIRSFVQSNDQTRRDFLPALAAEYAEACAEVNRRLAQCNRLLQQGLRSEAIHQAEGEPRLLDAVTTLDFPERAAWEEVVELYGFTASPALTVEMARFLNEAYAEEDPLQDLLRLHRREALARGPLTARLAVLRKMATIDAGNPVWPEDIRTFEKARLRQVQAEAAEVAGRRDVAGLDRIVKELEAKDWSERPPAVLVQGVKKSANQIRRAQARAELAALELDLNNAFAAFDVDRGRQIRQRWEEVVRVSGAPVNDPVRDRAEPALQWLAEQDQREQNERDHDGALRELESALDDDSPGPSELERLAHAVARHERGLPEPLERRLRNRLVNLELAASRRRRLIIVASAASILLVCSAAAYVVRRQAQAREVARAVVAINQMLAEGEVEQAAGFIDKLDSTNAGLFRSPALVEARSRTQAAQDREAERAEKFAEALATAGAAAVTVENPPALVQARTLARLDREKAAVERLARRLEINFRADRASRDRAMLPRIDEASQAVWRAEELAGKSEDTKATDEAVAEARGKLADLAPEIALVSDGLRTRAALLSKKLDTVRAELDRGQSQRRLEGEITRAIADTSADSANADRFVAALQSYIQATPNTPRALAFQQVLVERPLWDDAMSRARLSAGWPGLLTQLDAETATARAAECRSFLASHPNSPDAADLLNYQKFADAVARRNLGSDSPREQLLKLFADVMVDQLWMVKYQETKEAELKTYYLRKKPPENLPSLAQYAIRYVTGFDDSEKAKTLLQGTVKSFGESPQMTLAARVREIMKRESQTGRWEEALIEIALLVQQDTEVDPILRVALLDRVLTRASEGSMLLQTSLEDIRESLEHADIDINIPWMDPDSSAADRVRHLAERALKDLPSLADARTAAEDDRQGLERRLTSVRRPVGWLIFEGDRWQCRTLKSATDEGDLCVVVPGADKKGVWKTVGTVKDGSVLVTGDEDAGLAEGRPVFLFKRTQDRS